MKTTIFFILSLIFFIPLYTSLSQDSNEFTVTTLNNPSAGYLLVSPYLSNGIALIDNSGKAVYVTILDVTRGELNDLRVWSKNLATFWNRDLFTGYMASFAINDQYKVLDTFLVSPDYVSDFHEIQLLPNGNYMVLGEDWRTIDMSVIVTNGNPSARVKFNIIQEFDANHNLVWEWSTYNHFNITDATSDIDLTLSVVNFCHMNAFFVDTDGNVVLSSRLMDEVTKINKTTGQIMWRMGGTRCKNNQFTFLNDTHNNFTGFSHQHNIQRLANGNLLMFDNGNLKGDYCSRAVEYEVNESSKTVSKVWEYRHYPVIYTDVMGSAQRLPNGNTLIGWSSNDSNLTCTEVNPLGNIVFEMTMSNTKSYRIYRQIFKMAAVTRYVSSSSIYNFIESDNNTNTLLSVSSLTGTGDVQMEEHFYSAHNLSFSSTAPTEIFPARWVLTSGAISSISGKLYFQLDSISDFLNRDNLIVYYRSQEGNGTFRKLPTTYNSATRQLEVSISGFGEYIICLSELEQPKLISPSNNINDISMPFSLIWKKLFNADSYRLQISTSSNFNNMVFDSSGISDTTFLGTSYHLNNATKYFWRVNAVKNGQTTPWSDNWVFSTDLPITMLIFPDDSSTNVSVNGHLSWKKVQMADSYHLQLSDNQDFSELILNKVVNNNEYQYKDLQFNKRYYWKVYSSKGSVNSKVSVIRNFITKLDTVHTVNPDDNASNLNPASVEFSWSTLSGAIYYHFQMSIDSTFSGVIKDVSTIKDTFLLLTDLKHNTEYFWRIYGTNNLCSGEWSFVKKFVTSFSPPLQIQPGNYSRNQTISGLIKWENNPLAVSYHLEISIDSLFKNIIEDKDNYKGNSYSYQNFSYDTKYFWRVNAYYAKGVTDWSETWEFQTRQKYFIDKPILKTPENEQYNLPLSGLLAWEQNPNTNSYRIQVSLENTFNNTILDKDGLTTTEQEYGLLKNNSQYFWRIMANGDKTKSEWSEPGTFYTKLETPSLLVPANGATNIKVTTPFKWNPVDGASVYFVQFAKDEAFYQKVDKTVNINSITKVDWLSGFTKYYWRVIGAGGKKESDWSNVWSFTTDDLSEINEFVKLGVNINSYPNPFKYKLELTFTMISQSEVQISVFDVDGRFIEPTISRILDNGIYNIYFNTIDWNEGTYFIRIKINDQIKTIKAIKGGN